MYLPGNVIYLIKCLIFVYARSDSELKLNVDASVVVTNSQLKITSHWQKP